MDKTALAFLERLVAAPSPSGYEQPAQKLLRQRMGRFADAVRTDVHGNVIAALNPKARLRVMLAGHVDEIGFMVKHITDDGYIYIASIGGVDPMVAVGTARRTQGVVELLARTVRSIPDGDAARLAADFLRRLRPVEVAEQDSGQPVGFDAPDTSVLDQHDHSNLWGGGMCLPERLQIAERSAFWALPAGHDLASLDALPEILYRRKGFAFGVNLAAVAAHVHLHLLPRRVERERSGDVGAGRHVLRPSAMQAGVVARPILIGVVLN